MGLEPTRCDHHKILSLARLPIPTLPRTNGIIAKNIGEVNTKFERAGAGQFYSDNAIFSPSEIVKLRYFTVSSMSFGVTNIVFKCGEISSRII